jgi:hypothetical protein
VTKAVTPPSQMASRPIAAELEAIVLKCLSKSPTERYASVRELRDALTSLPRATDWDVEQARRWWRDFRVIEQRLQQATDMPTLTIELGGRDRLPLTA